MINLPLVLTYLLVAFIVMKVAGVIDWSWWLVISPLYLPLLLLTLRVMISFIEWAEYRFASPEKRKRIDTQRTLEAWSKRLARGDFR
jgi:uncharacterized membrane protein YhdT